jgi:S-adenosylmethionine:tRNA ribosyltransferase-isomerase
MSASPATQQDAISGGEGDESAPLLLSDYDYELPPDRIAQEPASPRDSARLLVLDKRTGALSHRVFRDLPDLLRPDDLLVVNETRVSAVRLLGNRHGSAAPMEVLLLRSVAVNDEPPNTWEALVRPARRARVGDRLEFPEAGLEADVRAVTASGGRVLRLAPMEKASTDSAVAADLVAERLARHGRTPLPPYVTMPLCDQERYQTVYARTPGSAAAPTAGLHFTPELLARIRERGIATATVRLDVGLGTFRPIRTDDVNAHVMHAETYDVSDETVRVVNACTGRVVAVGTTTLRALESAAHHATGTGSRVAPANGETQLFVRPGYRFRAVDALVTNFHQPHSTLLLLVAAFAGDTPARGRVNLRAAYQTALNQGYRFLSFGDAMFIHQDP